MNLQTLISDEVQLGLALSAFSYAHGLEKEWAIKYTIFLRNAGITSMAYLQQGCVQNTINLDLELFDIPNSEVFSNELIVALRSFLPGPVGFRCFRLAQKAAVKVAYGTANTEYVNRPANGKKGDELWTISNNQNWTLNVDCAGFVRNCLKHVTKNPFRMLLSDRDFMRAKDFYGFFTSLPYTILDVNNDFTNYEYTDQSNNGSIQNIESLDNRLPHTMRWRLVPDLRMVIPGDVIVYRPIGNAAGGAAFTEYDRKDLTKLLKAVKAAQLFRIMKQQWDEQNDIQLIEPRNVMKDPSVQPWVKSVETKLNHIGIETVRDLRISLQKQQTVQGTSVINEKLVAAGYKPLKTDTMSLMLECATTTALNTGHIVFAAGIAVNLDNSSHEYRIRVVHSTKFGKKDINGVVTTGVQEHYRRFKLIQEKAINPTTGKEEIVREFWTRTPREVSTVEAPDLSTNRSEIGGAGIRSISSNMSTTSSHNDDGKLAPIATPEEIVVIQPNHSCGAISEDDVDDANDDMDEEDVDANGTPLVGSNVTPTTVSTNTNGSIEVIVSNGINKRTGDGVAPKQQLHVPVDSGTNGTVVSEEEPLRVAPPTDELSGQSEIIVVAARMCF
jgi:hypothetical protein